MSRNYARSNRPHANAYSQDDHTVHEHSYNPSIHPETFELEKFATELIQKECDGYVASCEALKRIGIILNKYRLFIIKHNNAYTKNTNTTKLNKTRLGLVGLGSKHQPFNSMSIPSNNNLRHNNHHSSNMEIDLLAIYQEQVYGNHQPMMNRNQTNSMYDFVNFKLGENYNNTELLNDFHHLLYHHEKEYEQIYNYLVGQIGTKCVVSMCSVLQRNNNEFKIFADQDTIQEIETRQTINQIHCYFLHSYDIGYRFNDKETKTINQYSGHHDDRQKSVSEEDTMLNHRDESEDDDSSVFINSSIDERLAIINKMMHKKHQYILRKKNRSHARSHKSDNGLFENLHHNYHKYISIIDHDINKRFFYWDYYKTNMNIDSLNGGFVRDWYVKDKYGNLKQELLENAICRISKQMLEYLMERMKNLMHCDRCKRLRANSYGNPLLLREYNITKRSPITMDHILALIVYSCNHNNIQSMFLETFLPKQSNSGHVNMDRIIVHHAEFSHFSRLLRECTEIYGQTLRSSDKFYHIVHGQYLFRDCVFSSCRPISCTNSLYVACNILNKYSKNGTQNGLILQLSRFETNASFFDCKWLSHFVSEDEKLFYCSSGTLRICTILDIQNSLNYHAYISGINYLNALLHGDKAQDAPSKYGKRAMAVLMDNELNKSNLLKKKGIHSHYMMQNSNIPAYVDKLFTNYCCDKRKKIEIDVDRINDRYYSLKRHLMSRDDSWIDMKLLCTLFINVQQIIIKDGPYLTDNTFKQLLSFMDSSIIKNAQCKLTKIIFKYPKEEGIGAEEGLKTYYEAIEYRGWDTFYSQGLSDDLITMYFINNKLQNAEINGDIDYFAFELWKTLIRSRQLHDFTLHHEVQGNFLIHHIQQYFPNKFPNDDDILVMIQSLINFHYISVISQSDFNILASRSSVNVMPFHSEIDARDFRYQFEADKCREFVKRSESYRKKWTIGSKVKIFSSHHRSWKNASIVKEIGDILIVSFDRSQHHKTVDRYQQNLVTSITFHEEKNKHSSVRNKRRSFGMNNNGSVASAYYYNSNPTMHAPKRWSLYSGNATMGTSTIPPASVSGHTASSIQSQRLSAAGKSALRIHTATTDFSSAVGSPSYTTSGTSALQRGSSRVSFGAVLKRPLRRDSSFTSDTGGISYARHEIYHSGVTEQSTPRGSNILSRTSGARSRRSTHGTDIGGAYQPEFAPCRGDPFWDYYRTVGDMSRANCTELIRVMKWISAEDIMRQLLQNWLHSKIEPVELPYANPNLLEYVHGNFNLHAASVIAFVRQSLNSKQHPNCFDLPHLTHFYNEDYDEEDANNSVAVPQPGGGADVASMNDVMSLSNPSLATSNDNMVESTLNIIGQQIFEFLDQSSYLNCSLVSRSWLFCARSPRSRCHIRFRLWNALKCLIRDTDLLLIIEGSNDIVSIQKFMRDRNDLENNRNGDDNNRGNDAHESSLMLSDDDMDDNKQSGEKYHRHKAKKEDDNKHVSDDILINCAAGKEQSMMDKKRQSRGDKHLLRKRSTSHDIRHSFPHFFSTRVECNLFGNIASLQYDFNIPSHNKLIYYINQSLVDSYWGTLSILFGCISLRSIDILFPDPHILLAAYILQNSLTYSKYNTTFSSKRILFPSIGVPKSKFIAASRHLSSIRFAAKSLTISALLDMINTHFEHYYHPVHHKNNTRFKYHTLDSAEYAAYVYSQSSKKLFSKLDIYKLCKKIIHKSLIFDISNALYSLNHSVDNNTKPITSIQNITLCDVKCLNQELALFLQNNSANLKSIYIMFTNKCIFPKFNTRTGSRRKHTNLSNMSGLYSPFAIATTPTMSYGSNSAHSASHGGGTTTTGGNNSDNSANSSTSYRLHSNSNPVIQQTDSTISTISTSNKKMDRVKKTVNQLFIGILKYLRKETTKIHEHNHRIKKKFKLAKKRSNSKQPISITSQAQQEPQLHISYANKLRVLPLESLSFSFPLDVDISILDGYIELFKYFELNDCLAISLKTIYLDGGCLSPFTFNNNLRDPSGQHTLSWQNVLRTQVENIRTLCMKRCLYSSQMFYEKFSDGIIKSCKKIDLQIIYSDEYDDAYLHEENKRQPIRELLQALAYCQRLEILYLDLIQHPCGASDDDDDDECNKLVTMNPSLDILWLDQFMKSRNIKKTISNLHVTFNELVTKQYEILHPNCSKFIRRNHLNLGSILRINPSFKDNMEQLIMSWFGECAQLNQIRLLRHIQGLQSHFNDDDDDDGTATYSSNCNQNRYKFDENVDFQNQLPFEQKAKFNIDQTDHKQAFYGVSKRKKVGDFYRGDVFGELAKILQPQNPVVE